MSVAGLSFLLADYHSSLLTSFHFCFLSLAIELNLLVQNLLSLIPAASPPDSLGHFRICFSALHICNLSNFYTTGQFEITVQ